MAFAFFSVLCIGAVISACAEELTVAVIEQEPFVMKENNGEYTGFCIELLDHIAEEANFEYDVKEFEGTEYGSTTPGTSIFYGLFGQLTSKKADMVVGPITMTLERTRSGDFTDPIMDVSYTALLNANCQLNANISTIEDLANQDTILYGTVKDGSTMVMLAQLTNEPFVKIADNIMEEDTKVDKEHDIYVKTVEDGIEIVLKEDYALILEEPMAKYAMSENCNLRALESFNLDATPKKYGFAFQKGKFSEDFIAKVNQAIASADIEALKAKYWPSVACTSSRSSSITVSSAAVLVAAYTAFKCLF